MRTISINLYSFDELSAESQEKAIINEIKFFIDTMENEDSVFWDIATEMDKMQTPWFLGEEIYKREKQYIIDTIRANEYTFEMDGSMNNSTGN